MTGSDVSPIRAVGDVRGRAADPVSARAHVLGRLRLLSLTKAELFTVPAGELRHVVTVNAELFVLAHRHAAFGDLLARTLNTVDGRVVQWFARARNHGAEVVKLAGSDFIYDLAAFCAAQGGRLFLLGASPESNARARRRLEGLYPGLRVDGYSPPFAASIDERGWSDAILERIRAAEPSHLVVCFGPERQEFWIDRHRAALSAAGVRFAAGLGGSIDFVGGTVRRAPRVVQLAGLEWLFRLLCAPRARFRRTLIMFGLPYYALVRRGRRATALTAPPSPPPAPEAPGPR